MFTKMKLKNDFLSKKNIGFYALFLIGIGLLLWKMPFSLGVWDESFLVTLSHRMAKGDALLSEEWHVTQLSGVFLLPFMKLFTMVRGSTEGIMIASRVAYIVVHTACAVMICRLLKKRSGARAASLFYLIFVPSMMMVLAYATVGIGAVMLMILLLSESKQYSFGRYFLIGIMLAIATLACPYVGLLYAIYLVIVLGVHIYRFLMKCLKKDSKQCTEEAFEWKGFLAISAGAFLCACIFAAFVLSRASVHDIRANLKYILTPENPSYAESFSSKVQGYKDAFKDAFHNTRYVWLALIFVTLHDPKRYARRVFYFAVTIVHFMCVEIKILMKAEYITSNSIIIPWAVVGIIAFVLMRNKGEYKKLFVWSYTVGFLFTFFRHWASTGRMEAISAASMVMAVPTFILVVGLVKEMYAERREKKTGHITRIAGCTGVLMAFAAVLYMFFHHAAWMDNMYSDTARVQDGPYKGAIIKSDNSYFRCLDDVKKMPVDIDNKDQKIFFAAKNPWYYLWADMEYGTPSAWIENVTIAFYYYRLKPYYELHPDKVPDIMYIEKGLEWSEAFVEQTADEWGYKMSETPRGYVLAK